MVSPLLLSRCLWCLVSVWLSYALLCCYAAPFRPIWLHGISLSWPDCWCFVSFRPHGSWISLLVLPPPAPTPVPPVPLAPVPTPSVPAPAPAVPVPSGPPVPAPGTPQHPLFPNANISTSFRPVTRTPAELARANVLIPHDACGTPGSREYQTNLLVITGPPKSSRLQLDYVDVDILTDPTKFNLQLASCASSTHAAITDLLCHLQSYDRSYVILVPDTFDEDALSTVSLTSFDLLDHHARFTKEYIEAYQFFINGHS